MKDIDSRTMTWVFGVLSAIAFSSFLYMVVAFFRLDWVNYDTVDRFWEIEWMECVDQPVRPVVMFSRHRGARGEFPLRFNRSLYNHLMSQSSDTVTVNRRLVGYLREWDYGIIVPLSVAGKHVNETLLISQERLSNCSFEIDEQQNKKLLSTRRKMR